MSEQPDRNSPYYMPTPGEYLDAALKALSETTEENWRERVEVAAQNLSALGNWMGGHLLCGEDTTDEDCDCDGDREMPRY